MFKRPFLYLLIISTLLSTSCRITGKVVDENGVGVAGVTVTLGGGRSETTTTDSNGKYFFGDLFKDDIISVGSYTVTASKSGYSISPASRNVPITTQWLENYGNVPWPVGSVDFVATGDGSQQSITKFSLWTGKTNLRGANIWLTRSYNGLFSDQIGSVAVGPVYTQSDFDQLAAMGANYVNISHPGIYTETAPFQVDTDAQGSLDSLLSMIAKSDMFAVICFRSGPGRSEFTFSRDDVGDWFTSNDLDETVWSDSQKQDAWISMWAYTAQRYKDNAVVVAYDLMVEPNSDEVVSGIDGPDDFYPAHKDTLADWNQLYPRIITAIRNVDSYTPILVGGMGYSSVEWLPYLQTVNDSRVVYAVHQYAPYVYTHQAAGGSRTYPGVFDTDWDGDNDTFNKTWLQNLLGTADALNLTLAVNEFGIIRWVPNAADFMTDTFSLLEQRNWNHALWQWYPASYPGGGDYSGEFNFMYGPVSTNYTNVSTSNLIEAIKSNWALNTLRPSNVTFTN